MSKEKQDNKPGGEQPPNLRILPGHAVIAIDQTGPEWTEKGSPQIDLPTYPNHEALLGDPKYVRFIRFQWEATLTRIEREHHPENPLPFRELVNRFIDAYERDEKTAPEQWLRDSSASLRKQFLAIRADYDKYPKAFKRWLT